MTQDANGRSLYALLEVGRLADRRAIDQAYRRLSRRHHPDVCADPDAGARMRALNAAYAVLRDPERRREYDRRLAARAAAAAGWSTAQRAWRDSARAPGSAPPAVARARVRPGSLEFGFLREGEQATRRVVVAGVDERGVDARLYTRGDWLRADISELRGREVDVTITADPAELRAFWEGAGTESARIDGWLEIVDAHGSLRVPVSAILRREAAAWWNPFARRAG